MRLHERAANRYPVLIVGARTAGTSHCMRRCQAVTAPDAYAKNEAFL